MGKRLFEVEEVPREQVAGAMVWEDPPEGTTRAAFPWGTAIRHFVSLLQDRPGLWARYPVPLKNPHQYARLYRGTEWAYGSPAEDGRRTAWARWVGLGPTIPAPSSLADMWARLEAEAIGEPASGPRSPRGRPLQRDPDRPPAPRRRWPLRSGGPEGQP